VASVSDLQAAYVAQQTALVAWLGRVPEADADRPSSLAGWRVRELAFHTTEVPRALTGALATDPPAERALSIAAYTAKWRESATEIEQREREGAAGLSIADIIDRHDAEGGAMLQALGGVEADRVVRARRGPIRAADMLTTRINELVVHSLDLSASLPEVDSVAIDDRALAVSCRMLAAILAERVPGRSVEVRVAPYTAIQCIEGPRHTRGTPGTVVEVAPTTWVALATGRISWADAARSGGLQASGDRADISAHLPVLS
jgi:uncharacterized protein (TIGR03083 family)